MAMPVRIQRRRSKGWRMPDDTIYVGRPTKWGNPFVPGKGRNVQECVDLYQFAATGFLCLSVDKETVAAQERLQAAVLAHLAELRGKNLACFCPLTRACHADVLLALANGLPLKPLKLERIN